MSSRALARRRIPATVLALCVLALPVTGHAQVTGAPERSRMAIAFGASVWPDVGDLQPFLGGNFDEAGFAADLAFHWPLGRLGAATVLAGANIGGLFHGSDVRGTREGEDLEASVVYVTPSVKLAFGEPGGRRFYIDAGVGYYGTAIDEVEDDCFFSCDVYEYYDDDALGAYAGVSADFPFSTGFGLTVSAQAHFVDFDDPAGLDGDASLGGPLYTFQVGLAWGL